MTKHFYDETLIPLKAGPSGTGSHRAEGAPEAKRTVVMPRTRSGQSLKLALRKDPYSLEDGERCGVFSVEQGICEKPPTHLLTVVHVTAGTLAEAQRTCLGCCQSFDQVAAEHPGMFEISYVEIG